MFGLLLTHLEVPTIVQPSNKQQQSSAKVVSTLGVPQALPNKLGVHQKVETILASCCGRLHASIISWRQGGDPGLLHQLVLVWS